MCGIFGLVGERKCEFEEALLRGTHALAHRGPDDEGTELLPLASETGNWKLEIGNLFCSFFLSVSVPQW